MIQIGRFAFWVVVAVQLLLTDFVLLVYSWVTFSFGRPNFWQSLLHMNQGPSTLSTVQWMLFAVCFAGFLVVVGLGAVALHVDRSWRIFEELAMRFEPTTFLSDDADFTAYESLVYGCVRD